MNRLNKFSNEPKAEIIVCFISKIPTEAQLYIKQNLRKFGNVKLIFPSDYSEKSILYLISEADILIGWRPSKKILSNASNIRLFINPGAGIHHLLKLFREINESKEVVLINGHGNSYLVAQHTVALLLTLMNNIIPHHKWMREGQWRTGDKHAISIPLRNKQIGLLGYGAINQKVHKMLSGFEINFSIIRKHWNKQKSQLPTPITKFEVSQLHEFLQVIDILIIAVPVTSLTENMIGLEELKLLGPNGLLVNIARGDIINEESLYYALKSRIIRGAAIDVWYNYNPKKDHEGRKYPFNYPFHTLDNIVLSPHRGYSPFNDVLRWKEVVENISRMAQGRQDFINVVNLEEEY